MNGGDHPHLRAVEAPAERAEETPAEAVTADGDRTDTSRWLVPALGVGLVVCAGGWAWQARSAADLEARLVSTQAALARSEARVDALETHLGSVRDRFAVLQATLESELEALGGLLAAEPGEAPPTPR